MLLGELVVSADELVLFPAGASEKRNENGRDYSREEGEFRLSAAGIFLDLFPEIEIFFEGGAFAGIVLIEDYWIVLILIGVKKLPHELVVDAVLLLCHASPSGPVLWKEAECYFPRVLSDEVSLVGNAEGEMRSEGVYVDLL